MVVEKVVRKSVYLADLSWMQKPVPWQNCFFHHFVLVLTVPVNVSMLVPPWILSVYHRDCVRVVVSLVSACCASCRLACWVDCRVVRCWLWLSREADRHCSDPSSASTQALLAGKILNVVLARILPIKTISMSCVKKE